MATSPALGEIREVSLPAGTIRYRERGAGRPVVFVHGMMANGDLWRGVVPPLAASGLRCITPDWPFGAHEVGLDPDADLTPPGAADLVADFLAALDLSDVVLVGNDSGGGISQIVITRHPERIGALVLTPCDSFEHFPPAPFNVLPPIARVPGLRALVIQSMRSRLNRRIVFGPLMRTYDAELIKAWGRAAIIDRGVRRDALKFTAGLHKRHTLAAAEQFDSFTKPVLLAWPPDNRFFTYAHAERLAAAFPNARLVPVDGARTFLSLDQPERLAELIAEHASAKTSSRAAS